MYFIFIVKSIRFFILCCFARRLWKYDIMKNKTFKSACIFGGSLLCCFLWRKGNFVLYSCYSWMYCHFALGLETTPLILSMSHKGLKHILALFMLRPSVVCEDWTFSLNLTLTLMWYKLQRITLLVCKYSIKIIPKNYMNVKWRCFTALLWNELKSSGKTSKI